MIFPVLHRYSIKFSHPRRVLFPHYLTPQQIVASEGKRDTGAVASARAAEIYGLSILAERIQVRILHF